MNEFQKMPGSLLSDIQGPTLYNHEEILALRRKAWIEQGLLIVTPADRRLELSEKIELIRIAEALYGKVNK